MRRFTILALAVALVVAGLLTPIASSAPDGLQKVAADKGFAGRGRVARVQERAPARGYAFPGVEDARVATALAGLAGALGVFALGVAVATVSRRGERHDGRRPSGRDRRRRPPSRANAVTGALEPAGIAGDGRRHGATP